MAPLQFENLCFVWSEEEVSLFLILRLRHTDLFLWLMGDLVFIPFLIAYTVR